MKIYLALGFIVALCGCRTVPTDTRLPSARPISPAEEEMGYQDAVELGTQYMLNSGYAGAELRGAERVYPNIWCVRFGLAPKESGHVLELYFDGTRRTLVRTVDVSGGVVPPPP